MKFSKIIILCLLLIGCNASPTSMTVLTTAPNLVFFCKNIELTSPMTDKQLKAIQDHNYNFIYTSTNKVSENIYSINRADTLCAGEGYSSIGKIVSGFIVGLDQPNNKEEYPQSSEGVTYRYLRVRFVDKEGKQFDYWLQISGLTPSYNKFQIVSWKKPISTEENVFTIFLGGKNSDGTESVSNISDIIPNQLIRVNDQFIAIIDIGSYDGKKINTTQALYQFMQAVEGKALFPSSSENSRLLAGTLLIAGHP